VSHHHRIHHVGEPTRWCAFFFLCSLRRSFNDSGLVLIIKFKNCTVTHNDTILFQPEWGIYDMAVGKKVIAAFSGPADAASFDLINHVPASQTIKQKKSPERAELEKLYATVRKLRENKATDTPIEAVFASVTANHTNDWLLSVEIAELAHKSKNEVLTKKVCDHLEQVKNKRPEIAHLITNGFEKTQHQKIKNSGLDHFFKHMITSEQAGIMKPHAAIFEYALELTQSRAEQCVMIGDTLEVDILGAKNMGMDTIYFNPAKPHDNKVVPTYVIENLAVLKNIL
jgi:HAD superfamily hydrolase (TIGR01549 family)